MRFTYSAVRKLRAPTLAEADFSLTTTLRDRLVSGGNGSISTVGDRTVTTTTGATVAHEADLTPTDLTGTTLLRGYTWNNITPSVASFDSSLGRLTWASNGTAGVVLRTPWITRRADVEISRTGGATVVTTAFVAGSLGKHVSDAMDARIAGKTPSVAAPIFSTRDDANSIYVRNSSGWLADLNLTCMSVWNSSGGSTRAGTLISPRHVIFATHYQIAAGATLRFVTGANVVVERTLSSVANVSGSDFTVGLLDSDVPTGIRFPDVLPANAASYTTHVWRDIPIIVTDQEKRANVAEAGTFGDLAFGNAAWSNQSPFDATRQSFFEPLISGDSGSPMFALINGVLVLVSTATYAGAGGGSAVHLNLSGINAAMTSLGGGYQLTQVSLAGFPTYP
jgi:hypothetical protein